MYSCDNMMLRNNMSIDEALTLTDHKTAIVHTNKYGQTFILETIHHQEYKELALERD